MSLLSEIRERMRAVIFRARQEENLDEELRYHLELEMEANLRRGLSPAEARRQARLVFGAVERFKEEVREARGTKLFEDVVRDVRLSLRRLIREPGFTVAAAGMLALGIGVTAAIFTLVNSILLQPLPYPDSDRLVTLRHVAPGLGIADAGQSQGTYVHYRKQNRVFDDIGLYFDRELSITDGDVPERIMTALVTPSVLSTLRVEPFLGRIFTSYDGEADASRVVMISHDLWVRRYGADPQVIGRMIELNRGPNEIVGVMPPGFRFPQRETQLWFAMPVEATRARISTGDLFRTAIARLKPGVTLPDAERDLQRMIATLPDAYPDVTIDELEQTQLRGVAVPLKEAVVGDVRSTLALLLCTAAVLLLIALTNAANLFILRASRQLREIAVARGLGASTGDIARRFLTEGVLVAMAGGALAVAIAYVAVRSRFGFEPGQLPRSDEVQLGGTVLGVTVGVSLFSGALLGTISFFRAGRPDLAGALKGTISRVTTGRAGQRMQRFLVATQLALALTLLVASALLARSFSRLQNAELGFDPQGVLTLDIALPVQEYLTYQENAHFFFQLLEQIRSQPGVTDAEAGAVPLTSVASFSIDAVVAEDSPPSNREAARAATISMATPGYFKAMRIPLISGRTFQPGDLLSDIRGVIMSAALAETLFRDQDPIGRRVRLTSNTNYPYTIIGVAGNVPGETIADGPASTLYFPVLEDFAMNPQAEAPVRAYPRELTLVVRTSVPPTSLVPAVRRILREMDPKVPIAHVSTLEQTTASSMAHTRLMMLLLLIAAGTSLLLGVVGIYGVVAYAVSQRVPELGVRLALGATPAEVRRLVLRQGMLVALAGLGVGLLAAFGLTRLLRGLLYQVSPTDPAAFVAMPALLFAIALLASYLPARRAGRIAPASAIRGE